MTKKNLYINKYSFVSLLDVSALFVHYPQETPQQDVNLTKI
jgi:hypothetical protein